MYYLSRTSEFPFKVSIKSVDLNLRLKKYLFLSLKSIPLLIQSYNLKTAKVTMQDKND